MREWGFEQGRIAYGLVIDRKKKMSDLQLQGECCGSPEALPVGMSEAGNRKD